MSMIAATTTAAAWAAAAVSGCRWAAAGSASAPSSCSAWSATRFGIDPRILIGGAEILTGGSQSPSYQSDRRSAPAKTGAPTDEMGSMIAGVLGEIDDRWDEIFKASGQTYKGPRIVLFRNATNGGRCGMAQSAMGPFYCPPDRQIFLDTAFFRQVETRFRGCSGNACKFTAAYIIAHEVGHHVQNLLGILPRVTRLQQQARQQGGSQCAAGEGRIAGRLPGGRLGQPRSEETPGLPRAGRHRSGADAPHRAIGDDTLQRQPPAGWCRTRSPMAPPRSESSGS